MRLTMQQRSFGISPTCQTKTRKHCAKLTSSEPTSPMSRAGLRVIIEQLVKQPRQGDLTKTAHGVILSTAVLVIL